MHFLVCTMYNQVCILTRKLARELVTVSIMQCSSCAQCKQKINMNILKMFWVEFWLVLYKEDTSGFYSIQIVKQFCIAYIYSPICGWLQYNIKGTFRMIDHIFIHNFTCIYIFIIIHICIAKMILQTQCRLWQCVHVAPVEVSFLACIFHTN